MSAAESMALLFLSGPSPCILYKTELSAQIASWISRGGSVNRGECAEDDTIPQPAQKHVDTLFYLFLHLCQEPVFGHLPAPCLP